MTIAVFNWDELRIGDLDFSKALITLDDDLYAGESTCILKYPANETESPIIQVGHMVVIKDRRGALRVYDIVKKEYKSDRNSITAYGEARYYELGTEPNVGLGGLSRAANLHVDACINGTRWLLGEVFDFGGQTRKLEEVVNVSPLKALREVEKAFQGELNFRVIISGSGDMEFRVDLLEQVGEFTGFRIDRNYNLQSAEVEEDITELATFVYGIAEPSFGLVIETAEDNDARIVYGKADGSGGRRHRHYIHNSMAETQLELAEATQLILDRRKVPKIRITVTGSDIDDTLNLGDTGFIVVSDTLKYEARVIAHRQDLKDKSNDIVTIGDYMAQGTDYLQDAR